MSRNFNVQPNIITGNKTKGPEITLVALKLYLDHRVPRAISSGLRLRYVDVVTAYEDRAHELSDPELLDLAASLGRILFTQDDDLLAEAAKRQ